MKRAGAVRPGSLLSGHADGFGVAPPPLSQRSARTDPGPSLCFLTLVYASTHFPNMELRHRCRFDLDQNVRMIKASTTEKRACLTAPGPFEAVFNLGRPRLQGAIDVRGVEVQTDHIRHLEPGIIQNRLQVIQGLGYLGAHVPRMERVSLAVNGHLSRAIEDALRVADLVGLDEPVRVLPTPGVDDSVICCHICLLLPPLSPAGCGSTQVYCGDKRSAAHEPNVLFFAFSAIPWAESQRVACLYISATGLPLNTILGNSESGGIKTPELLRAPASDPQPPSLPCARLTHRL